MQPSDVVFEKTDAGRAEVTQRKLGLSPGARQILILVDGTRTVAAIKSALPQTGDADVALLDLKARGCIAVRMAPAATAETAEQLKEKLDGVKAYLVDFVNNLVGSDGKELVDEIGRCSTMAQLRAYGDVCAEMVGNFAGKKKADEFLRQLRSYLI